jgi:hypothetical protein
MNDDDLRIRDLFSKLDTVMPPIPPWEDVRSDRRHVVHIVGVSARPTRRAPTIAIIGATAAVVTSGWLIVRSRDSDLDAGGATVGSAVDEPISTVPVSDAAGGDADTTLGTSSGSGPLECVEGETDMNPPVGYDTSGPGKATAAEAVGWAVDPALSGRPSGDVVQLAPGAYGLRVAGRIVQYAYAQETRPGEWHVVDQAWCTTDPSR